MRGTVFCFFFFVKQLKFTKVILLWLYGISSVNCPCFGFLPVLFVFIAFRQPAFTCWKRILSPYLNFGTFETGTCSRRCRTFTLPHVTALSQVIIFTSVRLQKKTVPLEQITHSRRKKYAQTNVQSLHIWEPPKRGQRKPDGGLAMKVVSCTGARVVKLKRR